MEAQRELYLRGTLSPSDATFAACFDPPQEKLARGERKPSRAQKEEAYELWASALLLRDDRMTASQKIERLLALSPSYAPPADSLFDFRQLVEDKRLALEQVSSVSGTPESLRLAPATVIVVTAEEIAHRGYTDIEEILHDLPGFDISRGNGDLYANVYQRGFRSASDRMLFLVDGVEQNDLWSNSAYISRQYPLSNIHRIEVVYGPASTLYGANAYTGVLHVISKNPRKLLGDSEKGFAATAHIAAGSQSTELLDWTVAGKLGESDARWSLTGRAYRKQERDLSAFEDWDFDYSNVDYSKGIRPCEIEKTEEGPDRILEVSLSFEPTQLVCGSMLTRGPFRRVTQETPDGGETTLVQISEFGEGRARAIDRQLLTAVGPRFSDSTDDWSVSGRLDLPLVSLGFQTWRRREGSSAWYTELERAGSDSRAPEQLALWADARDVKPAETLSLSVSSSFVQQDGSSEVSGWRTFANGGRIPFGNAIDPRDGSEVADSTLDLLFQAFGCFDADGRFIGGSQCDITKNLDQLNPDPINPTSLFLENRRERLSAERLATVLKALWTPSTTLSIVGGLDLALTTLEAQPTELGSEFTFYPSPRDSPPSYFLSRRPQPTTPDSFRREALGAYVQFSGAWRDFRFSGGARWDRDRLRSTASPLEPSIDNNPEMPREAELGFGSQLSPRAAIVHAPEESPWTWKLIYAEGFKDPSIRQRFSSEPGRMAAQDLNLETARNLETGVEWSRPRLRLSGTVFETTYSDIVELRDPVDGLSLNSISRPPQDLPPGVQQFFFGGLLSQAPSFSNIGTVRVRGGHLNASWEKAATSWFANLTLTDPVNTRVSCTFLTRGCSLSVDARRLLEQSTPRASLVTTPVDGDGRPVTSLRVGDIADYRVNLGYEQLLLGSDSNDSGLRLRLHLRANHVGPRPTGLDTTVRENAFDEIEAVTLLHGALALENLSWGLGKSKIDLQLIGRNLLDEEYFDPGVERADGRQYAARIPQERRSLLLRVSYSH